MSLLRCDINFISVASEVRKKDNGRVVFTDYSSIIIKFSLQDILEKHTPRIAQVSLGDASFCLYCLEHKISRVYLAVRMWIRDADCFTIVFKDKDMIDAFTTREVDVLFLPNVKQVFDFGDIKFGEA